MASSLTTLDFLRGLCERNRHWYNSGKCNKRRSCGDADCGIHLFSACVRYDQIEHLLKTLENKVQIVGIKLKVIFAASINKHTLYSLSISITSR